ncbi:MAG: hypothetical protein AAFX93_07600 [Verrucomicrobiota bacterium]
MINRKIIATSAATLALISSASAGLIINGDFSSSSLRSANSLGYTLSTADVDGGWVSLGNTGATFNAGISAVGAFNNSSTSGNPNGFFLADNGSYVRDSTAWNLFASGQQFGKLTVDVSVLSTYVDNFGTGTPVAGAATGNSANVQYAVYGFTGSLLDLNTSLTTNSININNNRLATPGLNFTQLALGNFDSVGALNTWENQRIDLANPAAYDFYLVGFTAPFNGTLSDGVGIDNVTISVIPEPSAFIAGFGFLSLAYFVYRRRKASIVSEQAPAAA